MQNFAKRAVAALSAAFICISLATPTFAAEAEAKTVTKNVPAITFGKSGNYKLHTEGDYGESVLNEDTAALEIIHAYRYRAAELKSAVTPGTAYAICAEADANTVTLSVNG